METPAKKVQWTAEADRDLYAACLVALGEPKGSTLRQAVEILKDSQGIEVTVKAASHRVQHLQKLKRKEGTGPADGGSAKKKTATPKGKKRSKATADSDDEEEESKATPSKKPAKGKKVIKTAPVDVDEEEDEKPVKMELQDEHSGEDFV